MRLSTRLLTLGGLTLTAFAAQATVVYSNDFDAAPVLAQGVTSTLAGCANIATRAPYSDGQICRSDNTITLTLGNLPTHTSVSLGYVLAFLDSWDSFDGVVARDELHFSIDGVDVPNGPYTYNNQSGTVKNIGGGTVIAGLEYVDFAMNSGWTDTAVDMSTDPFLTFAHSASSITFKWRATGSGWQGGTDESFALDNIKVDLRGVPTGGGGGTVPEPASMGLVLAALAGGLGFSRRRRRT